MRLYLTDTDVDQTNRALTENIFLLNTCTVTLVQYI